MTKQFRLHRIVNFLTQKKFTNFYIIALFTLIIALIIFKAVAGYKPALYSDNAIYAHLAWFFTQGDLNRAVHIWWQPLYPFLGSLFFLYFKDIPLSLFYVSVVSGILLFIPVFLITYAAIKNRVLAVLAGLLAVFHFELIQSFYSLLTENLFTTLFMFSVLLAVLTISERKLIYAFFYGLVVGITYTVRSDVLLSYQIFLLFGLILLLFKQFSKSFYIKTLVISLLAFVISVSPYGYFNYQKFGFLNLGAKLNAAMNMPAYFSLQKNSTTTYAQDVWVLDQPDYDSVFFNKPFNYYRQGPELLRNSIIRFWSYVALYKAHENILVIYIALIGFVVSAIYFYKYFKAGLYLSFLTVLGFFGSLPFQPVVDLRYFFWLYPLFSIFSVIFLQTINRLIQKMITKPKFKLAVLIGLNLFLISFYFNLYKDNLYRPNSEPNSAIYKLSGEYLYSLKPGSKIMTRREAITYYAKGSIIYIPSSIDINELERYAKLYQTEYVVADKETFPPDSLLKNLMDEKQAPDWLTPIKIWQGSQPKTIIYKVN